MLSFFRTSVIPMLVVLLFLGAPVVRTRPQVRSSMLQAASPAKIVSLKIVRMGVASKKVSLLGVSVRPSTGQLLELGLKQVLVMDVGCRPSPVGLLPVVPDEMLMMASHGLCARLAVPKARRNSIGSVDNGGSHVSARWASSIQAVQIHLVSWIGSEVVVVVVEGPLLLPSGLAANIFLGTVRSGFGASVHLLATGSSRPRCCGCQCGHRRPS